MQHELYLREFSVTFLPSTTLSSKQRVCKYSVKAKQNHKQIILQENVHARVLLRVLRPIWNIHIYYQYPEEWPQC